MWTARISVQMFSTIITGFKTHKSSNAIFKSLKNVDLHFGLDLLLYNVEDSISDFALP